MELIHVVRVYQIAVQNLLCSQRYFQALWTGHFLVGGFISFDFDLYSFEIIVQTVRIMVRPTDTDTFQELEHYLPVHRRLQRDAFSELVQGWTIGKFETSLKPFVSFLEKQASAWKSLLEFRQFRIGPNSSLSRIQIPVIKMMSTMRTVCLVLRHQPAIILII